MLKGPDDAAADAGPRVAGGLGGKVVRVLVDDHGAAQNVRDGKPVGEDAEIGVPAAAEQGRQVPGVAGVLAPLQVEMAAGALKVRGSTGVPLVDVEAEDPGGAAEGTSIRVYPDASDP